MLVARRVFRCARGRRLPGALHLVARCVFRCSRRRRFLGRLLGILHLVTRRAVRCARRFGSLRKGGRSQCERCRNDQGLFQYHALLLGVRNKCVARCMFHGRQSDGQHRSAGLLPIRIARPPCLAATSEGPGPIRIISAMIIRSVVFRNALLTLTLLSPPEISSGGFFHWRFPTGAIVGSVAMRLKGLAEPLHISRLAQNSVEQTSRQDHAASDGEQNVDAAIKLGEVPEDGDAEQRAAEDETELARNRKT